MDVLNSYVKHRKENKMLKVEEIKQFIDEDKNADNKKFAKIGQRYYEGENDIKKYRMFYFNADGNLVEDTSRSNVRNSHPFFAELVDQCVQYILSGENGIFHSDDPKLQAEMDRYFNDNEDFMAELAELLTDSSSKGFGYLYAYKNKDDRISFQCADSLGVIEVRAKDTDDGCEYVIYHYIDRIDKGRKEITKIQVWDEQQTYFYVMGSDKNIVLDDSVPINPRPHTTWTKESDENTYYDGFGFIPFFRLDNNKKRISDLKTIKDIIDDYDLMASSLSNNLIDFDTPIHVVKGFQGDNLDELQQNLKTKKMIGVDENGGIEVHTVDVPYQARQTKLELDEKNIYRFGFGLNTAGLKDTTATTNVAIKSAYSLLDLKADKKETKLKQMFRKLLKVVLDEINEINGTDYQQKDVYFSFAHEVMINAQENAQIALIEAQRKQVMINILLSLAAQLDNETLMQNICDELEIDYEEIKGKLPDPDEAENAISNTQNALNGVIVEDEQQTEGIGTAVS